jgi:hypothetical protein
MKKTRKHQGTTAWAAFLSAALLCLFLAAQTRAAASDTLTGDIAGRVVDLKGGFPLQNAVATLVSQDRGWTRVRVVDSEGNFTFIQLEPGVYRVTASKSGYVSRTAADILIQLNQTKVVIPPFQLRPVVSAIERVITVFGERVRTLAVDLTVQPPALGEISSLVEAERAALVSLKDGAFRSNFDPGLLQTLPLKGARSFDQLALFAPGVFRIPATSAEGPAVGIGVGMPGQFSVNGLRGRSNNFTVDGSDNNDADIGVRRQGFVATVPQSVESIQDVQIMTSLFPAEFGRNSASVVNVVSRSGTSAAHGTLYGLFNDDVLNARNFFDVSFDDRLNMGLLNGGRFKHGADRHTQYGGTVGGPLDGRKVFYFASAERTRNYGETSRHFVVPADGERGLTVDPAGPGNTEFIPVGDIGRLDDFFRGASNRAGLGVFSLYPLPNNPAGPFPRHTYSETRRYEGTGQIGSLKFDWYVSPANSFFARYNITQDRSLVPFTSEALHSSIGTSTRTQNLSLFSNSSLPLFANALRVSYGRTRLAFPPGRGDPLIFGSLPDPASGETITAINTRYGTFGPFGATGPIGQLIVAPYNGIGVDVFNFPQGRVDNTYQLADSVTLLHPAHEIKFGFDFRRSQLNSFSDRNSRPLVLFGYGEVSSLCLHENDECPLFEHNRFLSGAELASIGGTAGFLQTISTDPAADTTIGLRQSQFDLFFQDNWRPARRLTLNLGVRYSFQSVPSETNRRIERAFGAKADQFTRLLNGTSPANQKIIDESNGAFDSAVAQLQGKWAGRQEIYGPDRNNFAPRLSFAWDPGGNGRSVIRGGYGVAFDATLGAITSQSRNVFPTFVPVNLDLNFNPQTSFGGRLNSASSFVFTPTKDPLIRPGTLNTFNLSDYFATGIGALLRQSIGGSRELSSNGIAFTLPVKDLKSGYAEHFGLSVERQIGGDLVVGLSYVGTRGIKLPRTATPNGGLISTPVFPVLDENEQYQLRDLPPRPPGSNKDRPTPGLGAFTQIENSASSTYHSMQLSVDRRLRNGFQFRSSWTWAHAIDDVSDPFDGRSFFALPQNIARADLERASSNFDVRHRLTGFLVWAIPSRRDSVWSRDWRLALTAEMQTGQPYTVNTAIDRNRDGNLTDRLDSDRGLTLSPGSSQPLRLLPGIDPFTLVAQDEFRSGRIGRNTFRADGIATVDAALSRVFSFRESSSLDLRVEAFNVFNRTHFGTPVRILESPGFGRSFDTQIPARAIRVAARVSF